VVTKFLGAATKLKNTSALLKFMDIYDTEAVRLRGGLRGSKLLVFIAEAWHPGVGVYY